MDQYTNYLDVLSQYPQQINVTSPFLSSASQPPSLSSSPVSSEGSDSLIDEAVHYGLFAHDKSHAEIYNLYDQDPANPFMAGTPVDGRSPPRTPIKHEYSFGYDSHMTFDSGFSPSAPTYQHSMGYASQEHNPMALDYPVHSNVASSLSNMLADSVPFTTVAPSATSCITEEEVSAYKLSVGIEELSISSPTSSPFFYGENGASSPPLLTMDDLQPIQACDPKMLDSPIAAAQSVVQPPPTISTITLSAPAVDSDYSPSGESEVEDENDYDYGIPSNRKKNRHARLSSAAHPYPKPSKAKDKKSRGTKFDIPIPVPGLTKNSRGRGVPKKTEDVVVPSTRSFWCSVKDCDKLFSRGEHLKRHIKSIHTDDKPFQCKCGHSFSRRDNLFQHMRAKGCVVWYIEGVPQVPDDEEDKKKRGKKGGKTGVKATLKDCDPVDSVVARIMADAKIAKEKRDRTWRQGWA